MHTLHKLYRPITSRPYLSDDSYGEHLPCPALQPFIACYWGMAQPKRETQIGENKVLVIPDTCTDVIFAINHSSGTITARFIGLQEGPFWSANSGALRPDILSTFAVRFHLWGARRLLGRGLDLRETHTLDLDSELPGWRAAFAPFVHIHDIESRTALANAFFLRLLGAGEENSDVLNALYHLLRTRGAATARDAAGYAAVGQRQLARLFKQHLGTTVKGAAGLIRYQNLWRDLAFNPHFDVQDAVYKYGFTDQAHLIHTFKRYHGMPPTGALQNAVAACHYQTPGK